MESALIGDRIRTARISAGLSQTELAKAVGVTRGLVGQWETHVKKPGRQNLAKIARTTLTSMEYLLDGKEPHDGTAIRPDERELILRYRELSDRQKKNLRDFLRISLDVRREIEHERSPAKV